MTNYEKQGVNGHGFSTCSQISLPSVELQTQLYLKEQWNCTQIHKCKNLEVNHHNPW
jgi:hypothetical protein